MVYLYDKNKKGKFVIALNYDWETFNPTQYSGYHAGLFATKNFIKYPILDNGIVREKNREELIIYDNRIDLLKDGEYLVIVEGGPNKIGFVPKPNGRETVWNDKTGEWEDAKTDLQEAISLWRKYITYDTPRCQVKLRAIKSLTIDMLTEYNNFMDSLEMFITEYEDIKATGISYSVPTPSVELQAAINKIMRW